MSTIRTTPARSSHQADGASESATVVGGRRAAVGVTIAGCAVVVVGLLPVVAQMLR